MELISGVFSFIINVDTHLQALIESFGALSYVILFFIVFAETGFVLTPFLPGDSLLFAAGSLAALGFLDFVLVSLLLWLAAFLGDTLNYWIGYYLGEKIIANPRIPINKKHLDRARVFYEKHGGKTIVLARFIPIIRTFAPFVAGIGKMQYRKFILFNIGGGLIWVFGLTTVGYFFGNLPWVKNNFSVVILAIIFISILPILWELVRGKIFTRKDKF